MKKLLSIIATLTFAAILLPSCSNSEEEEEGYDFIENATFDVSLMFGTWDIEYLDEPSTNTVWYGIKDISLTLRKDGKFNVKYSSSKYLENEITSDYKLKGETITLDLDPDVTIELTHMSEDEVRFIATLESGKYGNPAIYCKGEKR